MKIASCLSVLTLVLGFAHSTQVVCYFTNWATYRKGIAKYNASDIDPKLCTMVYYAFVGLWGDSGELRVLDPYSDEDLGNVKAVVGLKEKNPDLKVIISMGGWGEGSRNYSHVAANATLRQTFIKSILSYLEKNKFDGYDLDWEYPRARNGTPEDKENFVTLLCELKEAFKENKYLLSIAVSGAGAQVDESYDVPGIMKCVDYVSIMTYDLRTATSVNYTAHHSPLYPSTQDKTKEDKQLSVSGGVRQWLSKGAKPSKLLLGIPFYADTFKLVNPENHGLHAPTDGQADAGPLTASPGFLSYQEICVYYSNYTQVWDKQMQAPYAYYNTTWFGYDNPRTVKLKTQYALDQGLGGVMIWALDFDDFNDSCKKGKYPLLTTISDTINKKYQ